MSSFRRPIKSAVLDTMMHGEGIGAVLFVLWSPPPFPFSVQAYCCVFSDTCTALSAAGTKKVVYVLKYVIGARVFIFSSPVSPRRRDTRGTTEAENGSPLVGVLSCLALGG